MESTFELDEALVQIERTQRLEVGGELRPGISVRTREEREETRRFELELIQEGIGVERRIPHDVDLPDPRCRALGDLEPDRDPVAFERGHRARDLRTVLSRRKIRALQLLLHLVENRPVEDPPLRESRLLEGGHEILGLEIFVPGKLDAADGRPFDHRHHERIAVASEPYVAEEAGPEQRANGSGGARVVDGIADLDREVVEYGAGGNALETLQADVLDDERVVRGAGPHHGAEQEHTEGIAQVGQYHHQWSIVVRHRLTGAYPSRRARSL